MENDSSREDTAQTEEVLTAEAAPEDPDQDKQKKKKKKKRKKKKTNIFLRILKFFFGLFLVLLIAGMIGVIAISVKLYPEFISISNDMQDVIADMDSNSFVRSGNTEIYDSDGNLIGKFGGEKYVYEKIDSISPYIIDGYVAQEDQRYYEHFGIDLQAILRAAISLVKNHGHITQGASTITQQVVKNNLLTQERSYRRKIMEILLAIELEKLYTKEEILEIYCNSNYYGNGCYGVEAASQYYFGKAAKDVTPAEAAILVGTSNSPNNYNPVADYDLSMQKKTQVLENMYACGYLTDAEYQGALTEEPEIVQKTTGGTGENYQNSYAIHCAARILMEQDGFTFRYTFSSQDDYDSYHEQYDELYSEKADEIRQGGYTIYTSLSSSIQKTLQKSVDAELSEFTDTADDGRYEMQGAAVCIDNSTQMVVAIVGGRTAYDTYNRGFLAVRQPGSSIKPLLDYGPALNEGICTPATVIDDSVLEVNGYAPKNAGGARYGKISVREALNRSVNTIAFKLFLANGIDTGIGYLEKLHISTLQYADMGSSSLAIGGFTTGVTVEDMAKGYACIANGGLWSENTCITRIEHYTEGSLYKNSNKTERIFSADTAYMLTDMMEGVFNESYGTAHSLKNSSQIFAGKTGTTNDNKDAWFCGFSRYYTTAVWVGCDMPTPVDDLKGATYPGYIWSDFMGEIHENLQKKDFDVPDTLMLEEKSTGMQKSVLFTESTYDSRPSGWDYASGEIDYDKTLINFKTFFDDFTLE